MTDTTDDSEAGSRDDRTLISTPARSLTLLQLNHGHFPAEIVSEIISKLVAGGLQVSNSHSNLTTIRALLKTNIAIKHETLRQIYKLPLRVHITDGYGCGCESREDTGDDSIQMLLRNNILTLPISQWSEVVVTFAPDISKAGAASCLQHTLGTSTITSKTVDLIAAKMDAAALCVASQSTWIADSFEVLFASVSGAQSKIPIKCSFVFECPDVSEDDDQYRIVPRWDFQMVLNMLRPWRRTLKITQLLENVEQIALPSTMSMTYRMGASAPRVPFSLSSGVSPQDMVDCLWVDFCAWWSMQPVSLSNSMYSVNTRGCIDGKTYLCSKDQLFAKGWDQEFFERSGMFHLSTIDPKNSGRPSSCPWEARIIAIRATCRPLSEEEEEKEKEEYERIAAEARLIQMKDEEEHSERLAATRDDGVGSKLL